MCFTYCQVPIIYTISETDNVKVTLNSGDTVVFDKLQLDVSISNELFNRSNKVKQIEVFIKK